MGRRRPRLLRGRAQVLASSLVLLAGLANGGQAQQANADAASASALAVGPPHTVSMEVGGLTRTFVLFRPGSARPGAPLVILLHGSRSNGSAFEAEAGFDQLASAQGIVVAYPDALPPSYGWHDQCCSAIAEAPVDIEFLAAIIGQLRAAHAVGARRVVVAGFSSGGIMALDAGCKLSAEVGAVAAASGVMFDVPPFVRPGLPAAEQCSPGEPVTVVTVNGSADPVVPLAGLSLCAEVGGGDGLRSSAGASEACGPGDPGYEPPLSVVADWWARLDKCKGASTAPPTTRTGAISVGKEPGCPGHVSVTLVTVGGAGHNFAQIEGAFPFDRRVANLAWSA